MASGVASSDTVASPDALSDSPMTEILSRPPSRVTRRFLYFLLFLFLVGILASILIHIDITVNAPVVLRPRDRAVLIQPEMSGTILEVRVHEGQHVEKGDTLVILASQKAGEDLFAVREKSQELQTALREKHIHLPVELKKVQNEIASQRRELEHLEQIEENLQSRASFLRQQMQDLEKTHQEELTRQDEKEKQLKADLENAQSSGAFWEAELKSIAVLRRQGIASESRFREAKRSREASQFQLQKVRSQQREALSERRLLALKYRVEKNQRQADLAKVEEELTRVKLQKEQKHGKILSLNGEMDLKKLEVEKKELVARFAHRQARRKAQLPRVDLSENTLDEIASGKSPVQSRVEIRASVAGIVGFVSMGKRGELIKEGQTILRLIPRSPLVGELRVSNRDIALVKKTHRVKTTLQAFPFAEYGTLDGTVLEIAPDAEKEGEASFYRVTVELDSQSMRKQGLKIPLLSGMKGEAEIVTERKSLVDTLLTPFNGMRQ